MLHAFVPDEYDSGGRRIVHTDGFRDRVRKFRFYRRARLLEDRNFARLLR